MSSTDLRRTFQTCSPNLLISNVRLFTQLLNYSPPSHLESHHQTRRVKHIPQYRRQPPQHLSKLHSCHPPCSHHRGFRTKYGRKRQLPNTPHVKLPAFDVHNADIFRNACKIQLAPSARFGDVDGAATMSGNDRAHDRSINSSIKTSEITMTSGRPLDMKRD